MTMLSPVARIQYSQRSLLLAALSAEAARLLGSHLRETELREGALLWDAGPDAGRIFFPISGIISVRVPTGTGHGIEVATIGPEAAAGFHDGWARVLVLTRAVVHSSGRFAIISVEAFHAAAGHAPAQKQILTRLCLTPTRRASTFAVPVGSRTCRGLPPSPGRGG